MKYNCCMNVVDFSFVSIEQNTYIMSVLSRNSFVFPRILMFPSTSSRKTIELLEKQKFIHKLYNRLQLHIQFTLPGPNMFDSFCSPRKPSK